MLALSLATAGVAAAATKPEFKPVPTKKKLTITGGAALWNASKNLLECEKSTGTGEIESATKLGRIVMKFTGCISSQNDGETTCPAHTVSAKEGEFVTKSLAGELGTVSATEAPSETVLYTKPETGNKWMTVAVSACVREETFSGALAGEVATKKKQITSKFTLGTRLKEISLDSGEKTGTTMEAFGEAYLFSQPDEITFEEALEVT